MKNAFENTWVRILLLVVLVQAFVIVGLGMLWLSSRQPPVEPVVVTLAPASPSSIATSDDVVVETAPSFTVPPVTQSPSVPDGGSATPLPPSAPVVATLPPATGQVSILSISVDTWRIPAGGCFNATWAIRNADQVRLLRDENVILENGQLEQTYQDCLDQAGVYQYRLEAENSAGNYNFTTFQMIVDAK